MKNKTAKLLVAALATSAIVAPISTAAATNEVKPGVYFAATNEFFTVDQLGQLSIQKVGQLFSSNHETEVYIYVTGTGTATLDQANKLGFIAATNQNGFKDQPEMIIPTGKYVGENGQEINVENPDQNVDLKVESVSAINKTVTLNVASLEPAADATAKVAIFALNDKGEKTGTAIVTANNVTIEENVVTFDVSSKTFGDDEYVVEVTIGETTEAVNVTVEFDAVEKLVSNINKATAAQLATLLNNEAYFTGFDAANVDAYKALVTGTHKTVAEVQKDVIDAAAKGSEFAAFTAELLDDEKGTYAKYLVLKGQFSNVQDANMDDYMATTGPIFNGDLVTLQAGMINFDAVSDAIDVINLDAVVTEANLTIAGAKPSELNDYKAALEALVLANDEVVDSSNSDTKAEIIADIDVELKAIADAREAADAEIVKAEAALAAFEAAYGSVPAETDVAEYDNVVAEISALEKEDLTKSQLATATLTGAVAALKAETEELTIVDDALEALAAFELAFGAGADQETEYTDVTAQFTDFDAEDYSFAMGKDIDSLKIVLAALKAETAKWEVYNAVVAAKTNAEMRDLLYDFGKPAFTNLSSVQKLEFAGKFITAVAKDESANFAAVEALLGTELTAYAKLIDDVNNAETISDMQTALEAISDDYDKLGAKAKADIAETVLAGTPYTTIAAIVEAMGL